MQDTEYNGWTNYQTWLVNLWLNNDSDSCECLRYMARDCLTHLNGNTDDAIWELAKRIEENHEELTPEITGVYADLLSHSLRMVEWREIAKHIIEQEIEEWKEENEETENDD